MNLFDEPQYESGANISPCGLYRYSLWRRWEPLLPTMCFIMLNPSKADATEDDPTIRRCLGFAKREHCGGIYVVNVFAFRATDPSELITAADPVGPENWDYLLRFRNDILTVPVAAWGVESRHPRLRTGYVNARCAALQGHSYCLGKTKDGHPRHPLYVKADAPLIRLCEVSRA